MAGFRLKMATQQGEHTAKEKGETQFPVNVLKIAETEGISVAQTPQAIKGASSMFILARNKAQIFYSPQYDNVGFERFSIAHELGHYFLSGHPEEIEKAGGRHESRCNFTEMSSIELEADHFASGLLMPSHLVQQFLRKRACDLESVIELSGESACSLTAAAIRMSECSKIPVAVIVSHGDKVVYCFMSESFKGLGKLTYLRKSSPLPQGETLEFNRDQDNVLCLQRAEGETSLEDWFDGSHRIKLREEVMGLGKTGNTLTVLSGEELPDDFEEDDEENESLEEKWTPRFSYGR
jgi:Zn-dependent peptidase ImmA (M78 family)